jgi:hypothetical protein
LPQPITAKAAISDSETALTGKFMRVVSEFDEVLGNGDSAQAVVACQ